MKDKLYITLRDFYLSDNGYSYWLYAEIRNPASRIKIRDGLLRLQKPVEKDYRFYAKKFCEMMTSGKRPTHVCLINEKIQILDNFRLIIDGTKVKDTEFDFSKFLECFEGDVVGVVNNNE